jgi:hypothetical protein
MNTDTASDKTSAVKKTHRRKHRHYVILAHARIQVVE